MKPARFLTSFEMTGLKQKPRSLNRGFRYSGGMRDIPYHQSPAKNACAFACYLMTGQAMFPDMTPEQMKSMTGWEEGYVLWGMKYWLWLMDQGVRVTNIDTWDYDAVAQDGLDGLRRISTPEAYDFTVRNTRDITALLNDIRTCFAHPNFTYIRRAATIDDIADALDKNHLCEVVLDSRTLNEKDGYVPHRVVPLEMTDKEIVFHNPAAPEDPAGPHRREKLSVFERALARTKGEVTIYMRS